MVMSKKTMGLFGFDDGIDIITLCPRFKSKTKTLHGPVGSTHAYPGSNTADGEQRGTNISVAKRADVNEFRLRAP